MAFWNRFFGSAGSQAAGIAIGATAVPALLPATQELINEAWSLHPNRPPDVIVLTQGVAQGQVPEDQARTWSKEQGYGDAQFDALVQVANTGPGVAAAFELWRRNIIGEAAFRRALLREAFEPEWIDALVQIKRRLLSVAELANAVVQGHMAIADATADAELQGYSADDFNVLVANTGLPPGPETGLDWLRRGILTESEFGELVREGHTKTKYIEKYLAALHPVLSAVLWATLHLKGHATAAEMNAGGAATGYTPEQMNLIYLSMGRPAAPGQMWTAAARGIDGPDGRPVDQAQFQKAIAQSDIRPEYGPMLWQIRYLYPSLFQLTRLVTGGTITPDVGAEWARKARYAPEVVEALLTSWTGGTAAGVDSHVSKAQTQLWGTLHRSYVADETPVQAAQGTLAFLGLAPDAVTGVLDNWNRERALIRKQLTPAQIKKAVAKKVTNPATGAPWTNDDAVARLHDLGYSIEDAQTFMAE